MGERQFASIFPLLGGSADDTHFPFPMAAYAIPGIVKDPPRVRDLHPAFQNASAAVSQNNLLFARLPNEYCAKVQGVDC